MRSIIIIGVVSLMAVSCKKNHVCYCKNNSAQNLSDFSNSFNATKKSAQTSCDNQNAFWSPEFTCTLK